MPVMFAMRLLPRPRLVSLFGRWRIDRMVHPAMPFRRDLGSFCAVRVDHPAAWHSQRADTRSLGVVAIASPSSPTSSPCRQVCQRVPQLLPPHQMKISLKRLMPRPPRSGVALWPLMASRGGACPYGPPTRGCESDCGDRHFAASQAPKSALGGTRIGTSRPQVIQRINQYLVGGRATNHNMLKIPETAFSRESAWLPTVRHR